MPSLDPSTAGRTGVTAGGATNAVTRSGAARLGRMAGGVAVCDADAGRDELAHRARVKIEIARAAGVAQGPEFERARRVGILAD